MLDFTPKGAIFDVDDTLLDNIESDPADGLHERSRLAAVHEVGRARNLPALVAVTPQQNLDAFLEAPVHTIEAAVWNIMLMTGLADSDVINPEDSLLREIVSRKNVLHKDVLREFGKEVPGATAFVRALAESGLREHLAIASSAVRQDIDIFVDMMGLGELFPSERIITKENVEHYKPHPEAFNRAFDTLGLGEADRAKVLAFEDDPRGIMSAKAAGLYVCAITTRFSRENLMQSEVAPDLVADSYQEFAKILELKLGD